MSAPILALADEVVELLNEFLADQPAALQPDEYGVNTPAVATRSYNPLVDLKNLNRLRVVVYPAINLSEGRFTRSTNQFEYRLEVLFQDKLGPPGTEEWNARIDALIELVDQAAELFRDGDRLETTGCYCVEIGIEPVFAPEHLDQRNVFSSVIGLTFRQERS